MVFVGAIFAIFLILSFWVVIAPPAWSVWINAVGLLALINVGTVPFTRAVGQPPYSQIFFFAASAFGSAWLATEREWLPVFILLAVLLVGASVAFALGMVMRRLQKPQINVISVVLGLLGVIGFFVFLDAKSAVIRNVPVMESFGLDFKAQVPFVILIWGILVFLIWMMSNIFDSFVGRGLVVALKDEALADEYGIDPISAIGGYFVCAAMPAVFAGWVFAFWQRSVGSEVASPALWLICVLVCLAGAWLGAWGTVVGSAVLALPLALATLPALFLRWDVNAVAAIGVIGCAFLMWAYAKRISLLFYKLRRRIDPHEVDFGVIDERSGMKAHGVPPPGTEILRLDGVAMGESTRPAIQSVSLTVATGDSVAIICDRADTRRALLALLSGRVLPRKGDVKVWGESGQNIAAQNWGRHGIARTHQPARMIDDFCVLDNVSIGTASRLPMSIAAAMLRANMMTERVVRSEAMYHLSRVWMREEAQASVKDLSESRKQLIELARALTADPALIVVDNMSASISEPELSIVREFLRDLCASGVAIIVLDDDWEFARTLCSRMVLLESGLVSADGPTERVLAQSGVRTKLTSFGRDSRK